MVKLTDHSIEKILSIFLICLIPLHILGSCINAINSIDKGYGHSYPQEAYCLIGVYLLVVIAIDVYIIIKRRFIYLKAYTYYWVISSVIIFISLIGFTVLSSYELGSYITLPLMATPYGILFPVLEYFFIDSMPVNGCIVLLDFCLINCALCTFIRKKNDKLKHRE